MLNGVVKLYTLCCDGNPVILDYLQNDLLKSLINGRDYWEGKKSAGLITAIVHLSCIMLYYIMS